MAAASRDESVELLADEGIISLLWTLEICPALASISSFSPERYFEFRAWLLKAAAMETSSFIEEKGTWKVPCMKNPRERR